jgi:hypothetical protein
MNTPLFKQSDEYVTSKGSLYTILNQFRFSNCIAMFEVGDEQTKKQN